MLQSSNASTPQASPPPLPPSPLGTSSVQPSVEDANTQPMKQRALSRSRPAKEENVSLEHTIFYYLNLF